MKRKTLTQSIISITSGYLAEVCLTFQEGYWSACDIEDLYDVLNIAIRKNRYYPGILKTLISIIDNMEPRKSHNEEDRKALNEFKEALQKRLNEIKFQVD